MTDRIFNNKIKLRVDLVLFFLLSYIVSFYYINGDQFHYLNNYEEMKNVDILYAFSRHRSNLSTSEPIYFLLSFFLSNLGISKILLCSILNCILYINLKKYFESIYMNKYLIYIILFTNFYLLVVFFSDDRLKLAYLFLILWHLTKSKFKFIYLFLSIGSHVQVLISLFSVVLLKPWKIFSKNPINLFFQILVAVVIINYLYEHITTKSLTYIEIFADRDDLSQYLKFFIFLFLTLSLTKKSGVVITAFIPLFFALILFGPTRVNMLGYLVMMYFGLSNNRGLNFPVLATSLYLCIKGIIFYLGVFFMGDGFGYDSTVMQDFSKLFFL